MRFPEKIQIFWGKKTEKGVGQYTGYHLDILKNWVYFSEHHNYCLWPYRDHYNSDIEHVWINNIFFFFLECLVEVQLQILLRDAKGTGSITKYCYSCIRSSLITWTRKESSKNGRKTYVPQYKYREITWKKIK